MSKEQKYVTKEDEKSVHGIVVVAQNLPSEIVTYEQAVQVAEVLVDAKNEYDRLEEQRKRYTAPINESIARINEDVKKITGPLSIIQKGLKDKIENYANNNKAELIRQAKASGIKGKALEELNTNQKIVAEGGEVRFRTDYDIKVTNKNIVPEEFYVLDTDAILTRIKAGEVIPGIKVVESYSAAVYKAK